MGNVYFELTEAFNAQRPTVVLASGQAVVYYRIAIMSKDGDWIVREAPDACERVMAELERQGATYRPSAPLDVRWLAGGWSSHFEFADDRQRRIRCDLSPEREVELTTDPDRVMALARVAGPSSARPAVHAALAGDRRAVVLAIASETDDLQAQDRRRVDTYEEAAVSYLDAFRREGLSQQPLRTAHTRACALAEQFLPLQPWRADRDADVE